MNVQSRKRSWGLTTAVAVALGLLATSCWVPTREFDETLAAPDDDADDDDSSDAAAQPSALCVDYCADIMDLCDGDLAAYGSVRSCRAVCSILEDAPDDANGANPAQCRAAKAELRVEPQSTCLIAGPTGREYAGDSDVCGSPCESYCQLYTGLCAPKLAVGECLRQCSAVPDMGGYDLADNYLGDSIQCRLVHLEAASLGDETHCVHSRIASPEKCNNADEPPTCDEYCQTVMVSCTGELAVYKSEDACLASCEALDKGKASDRDAQNTVGCRHYHAYSGLGVPAVHCPHAGPAGDGHCGGTDPSGPSGNCASYCRLARAACDTEYEANFVDDETCQEACEQWSGASRDTGFSIADEGDKSKTVQCRILEAVNALEQLADGKRPSNCPALFGGRPCE